MERDIYGKLLEWKGRADRKPLLLEGVRQCGKTYILKKFGEENYDDVAYFVFEKNPGLQEIFQTDLDPRRIVDQLSLLLPKRIEPGRTLIIFDEIQACNRAITSLKFFCEEAPEYHVACAGSLLGVLTSKPYSFPVGKVNRLEMWPMSFREFLLANSEKRLVEHIDCNDPTKLPSLPVVSKLNTYLDYYFLVGGMPAAVGSWVKDKDIKKVDEILDAIIDDYEGDFSRHAPESLTKMTLVWRSIPAQLAKDNNKFVFGHVKTGARSKDLDDALEWLFNAGLAYKVCRVDPPKLPLRMFTDPMSFKVYMADVGILRRLAGVLPDFIFSFSKEYDRYRGAVAENYVLNELIASGVDIPGYWRSGGVAEVDFIAQIGNTMTPIEVKAGSSKSKSLLEFIGRYAPEVAITTSVKSGRTDDISFIPLYAVWRLRDYVIGRPTGADERP